MTSRRFITFEGDLVTEKEETIIRQVALNDFLPLLETRPTIYSPVLPTNTRAEFWNSSDPRSQQLAMLIEREPQIINMNFIDANYRLSVPWTRFYFFATTDNPSRNANWQLTEYRVFWAAQKYRDPNAQDMMQALIPNVYGDGRICFGSTAADANQILAERIDQTINEFYISNFNNDLTIRYPNGWRNWNAWIAMTENNPIGWADWTDWTNTTRQKYSFNDLTTNTITPEQRAERIISPNGIPPLNLGATWGAAEEWWNTLTNNQRARLANIAANTPAEQITPTST